MEFSIKLYSQDFCPSGEVGPFHITVEESIWKRVYRETEEGGRIFLRIFNEEGTKEWIAPMGGVVYQKMLGDEEHHFAYMPFWMLDSAGFKGNGETLKCSVLTNEAFPEATNITLRVVDSAFYNSDVKAELEAALTQMGILRRHTTIQIPVQRLGNFPVELFISNLEPADCVLCDGDEVKVEFEEPVDHYEPPPRPPTPIPELPAQLLHSMVPEEPPTTAFRGEGHLLGSSNDHIPEWRRQLGPPRRENRKP